MKLKDIADMHDFLEDRCYCPGEIYDMTGFFFHTYDGEDDCELLCEGEKGLIHGMFVIVNNQILYFEITNGRIDSAVRLDATDNNKSQILAFMSGTIDKMEFDEFSNTKTADNLKTILENADAIMIDAKMEVEHETD